ncbi:MAG TPA: tRNA (adenosine(37)-N6)-threonylcarbamoyltransferase complex ATPase subunit type 1 TsaE, partial [Bacteroidia bacterium]|nr:tRNA (adenosine(37)-N6)-threonylcarbamoyltransferase complex ATPase subunit type 1 TsaE [Bacteroidia bacterium]
LGVKEAMSSPTFSLVNEYRDAQDDPVYHFDLYRVKTVQEALDIGLEDYLYSGNYCFIEWPEIIENVLPENAVKVDISESNRGREIRVSG